jgi:hypothetical protein
LAPGESGVDIVPPLDPLFTSLPAKVDYLPIAFVRKIAEAALEVLDLDAVPEYLLDAHQEFGERIRVPRAIDGAASAFGSTLAGALHFRLELLQNRGSFIYPLEEPSYLR